MLRASGCLVACLSAAVLVPSAYAEDETTFDLLGLGARYGISDYSNSHEEELMAVYANLSTPWNWSWDSGWHFNTEIMSMGGIYEINGHDMWHVAIGPNFRWFKDDFPLHLQFGIAPTYLDSPEAPHFDAGGELHFTSHLGVVFEAHRNWHLGLTFQHTSNADTNKYNPGIDVLSIDVSYRF
ncbi:acyloxyacyl hydrolase [Corallincola platygyrae]|uniref:Acyloxyacyl hydrolase n=1 Tax=Corallincola platygyrae TaxID=1193278 RepID=A0ABW4XQN0_9GAMM